MIGGIGGSGRSPIAFFVPHLDYGGVERVTLNLATGLCSAGHEVQLLVPEERGALTSEVPGGVDLVSLGSSRVAASIPKLARYLKGARPRALLSAKTHANVAAIVANRLSGTSTPQLVCEHSYFQFLKVGSHTDRIVLRLARRLYASSDRLVAVTEGVAERVATDLCMPRDRISVIANPVVTDEMRRRAEEPAEHPWLSGAHRIAVAAGRLSSEKAFDTLIHAIGSARERVDVRLLILGDGPERERLETLIAREDLSSCVMLAGYVRNPLPFMRAADLYVLSSRYEAFPTVLVEALYCGARIVATDCSDGVRSILADGEYGRIVSVGDPGRLAAAIVDALESPGPVDADRRRARADEFSVERAVGAYLDAIEQAEQHRRREVGA